MSDNACYCGGVMADDHYCDYGNAWDGWASTPIQRVEFVRVPDDEVSDW